MTLRKVPTSFKKLAMITDIHFGRRNNSPVHNQDCVDVISWFCAQVRAAGDYSHVCFLGDWFESRSAINILTMEYSYQGLKLLDDLGLPVYFVVGNHDLHRRTTRDVHSVRMFSEFKNITVIDKPTEIDGLLFSPFLFEHEYAALIPQSTELWAFLGHFEFRNFVITGYNTVMEHGPDHKLFSGLKRVFSGHFHKRQCIDNVHYIGNAFPMDFGDVNDAERGMCTYYVQEDRVEYKNWPDCPRYGKITLSKVMDGKDWNPVPKMKVRCIVDVDIGYQDAQDLREAMITEYGLRDFILDEDRETKQGLLEGENFTVTEAMENFTSIDELVVQSLEASKADKGMKLSVDELIRIYKDIKVEEIVEGNEE